MHSSELVALELSVLLFIVHVLVQSTFARGEFGDLYLFSPRDEQRAVKGTVAARAERALKNFTENYGAFIAVDLGLIATGQTGGWGAMLWSSRASPILRSISPAFRSCALRAGSRGSSVF